MLHIHTNTNSHTLHLSPLHICAIAHHWFTEHIWVQQWWLKQADSFKAEGKLESHYRYNWISFQPCERKNTCHHPGENGAKIQSLYLLRYIEGVCLCTDVCFILRASACVSDFLVCHVGVCCTFQWINSQDTYTSAKWMHRERNGLLWCSLKHQQGTNWRLKCRTVNAGQLKLWLSTLENKPPKFCALSVIAAQQTYFDKNFNLWSPKTDKEIWRTLKEEKTVLWK